MQTTKNKNDVEAFLEGQRRAQEDSVWKTSTGVKETMAKLDKLQKKIAASKKEEKFHKLTFRSNATTRRLARETLVHKKFKIPFQDTYSSDKSFWLVKDEGIYIMSAFKRDSSLVSYAVGYKPTEANKDTLWEKTHRVSGDDFAESIPLTKEQLDRIIDGGELVIYINETALRIEA